MEYEFRVLRSWKSQTVLPANPRIGEVYPSSIQPVSEQLQYRPESYKEGEVDWIDVPVVDFNEDSGEYM